jgi:hypothetical protein
MFAATKTLIVILRKMQNAGVIYLKDWRDFRKPQVTSGVRVETWTLRLGS